MSVNAGSSVYNEVDLSEYATKQELDDATAAWSAGYTPKGPASVSTINGLTGQQNGDVYTLTDGGTVNPGALTVSAGDQIAWDAANSVWYKFTEYATKSEQQEVIDDINVIELSLYGEKINELINEPRTTSTDFIYNAVPLIGLKLFIDYENRNTSGTSYFSLTFLDENGTAVKTVNGSANAGETKTYSSIVPVSSKIRVRCPAYAKTLFELYVKDPIVSNFDKIVYPETRFNYNNLPDVVIEDGETKQVRVNTNTYFPKCLEGKTFTIKSIIDCPISTSPTNFGYWDSMTYDSNNSQWILTKSVTVDNFKPSDTRSNAFMYSSYTNNTGSAITVKLNSVIYEFDNVNDAEDFRRYLSLPEVDRDLVNFWTYEMHVGASYNSSTEGWGVTKFSSPYLAANACKGHGSNILEHCKVIIDEAATYDISAEIAPAYGATATSYLGIVLDSYTPSTGIGPYFEMVSADIQHPENYVIYFNGAYNYGAENMPTDQGIRVAIMHIVYRSFAKVKGIKFVGKNGRYCIHPEFGRQSTGSNILFENCIFKWEGAEQVTGYNGNAVGMGIDAGDEITFKKCKWASAEDGGVNSNSFAHNNGYNNSTEFILSGAKLNYIECNFGGWIHGSYSDNSPNQKTHDVLTINNCYNIGGVNVVSGSNWRLVNIASDIS